MGVSCFACVWVSCFDLSDLFELFESFVSVELFRVVGLRLFGLCLFGSWLFELCVFVSSELFGLRVFKFCVGLGCASCFVRAWFSHFCFAFVGFVALVCCCCRWLLVAGHRRERVGTARARVLCARGLVFEMLLCIAVRSSRV